MTLDIICPSAGPTDSSGLVDIVKIQFDNALEKSLEICGMDASGMIL